MKSKYEQLLRQNPTNYDLRHIIVCSPAAWKERVWKQLLKQNPTNEDLRYIIKYGPKRWKEKAEMEIRRKIKKGE